MTEPDDEDRQLLTAHLGGDPHAFDTLVRRHRPRMWAVAVRTLSDPEEASDAVQDACISAYRSAASFRGDAKVSTWLHRIVVNACLDRVRRKAVRPTVPLPEEPMAEVRDVLGERETAIAVHAALAQLPDDQRLAIVLIDLEGMSVDEAAAILQVPSGTVKSRCFRGRARLAVSLGYLRNPDAAPTVPPEHPPALGGPHSAPHQRSQRREGGPHA